MVKKNTFGDNKNKISLSMNVKRINWKEIIAGIKKQERKVFDDLEQYLLPIILRYIRNNSGGYQDIKDIYQEALWVIYQKTVAGFFDENPGIFPKYFLGTVRLMWLNELDRRAKQNLVQLDLTDLEIIDESDKMLADKLLKEEYFDLIDTCLGQLTADYQELLRMRYLEQKSLSEIAQKTGRTYDFTRTKLFRGRKRLRKIISNHQMVLVTFINLLQYNVLC